MITAVMTGDNNKFNAFYTKFNVAIKNHDYEETNEAGKSGTCL